MRRSRVLILILLILIAGATVYAALVWFRASDEVACYEERDAYLAAVIETAPEMWTAPEVSAPSVTHQTPEVQNGAAAQWTSPEGIEFISYVDAWDTDKLSALYTELMRNTVGPEIEFVEQVTVNASSETELVLGEQEESSAAYTVDISHGALPDDFCAKLCSTASVIRLYDGNIRTDAAMMARTLAHEYGHHYTNYYMFADGDPLQSEYARLRGVTDRAFADYGDYGTYLDNHKWYLQEIAAEDYVQLLGSPTVTQTGEFYDVADALEMQLRDEEIPVSQINIATNASPQENMALPLAGAVPGLADYMLSFVGKTATRQYVLETDEPIEISIDRHSRSYDLTRGRTTYTGYTLTWNAPIDGCVYTLCCYDADYELLAAVRTVHSKDSMTATVGTAVKSRGDYVYTLDDGLAEGTRIFIVTVLSEDGRLAVSEPLTYDFS